MDAARTSQQLASDNDSQTHLPSTNTKPVPQDGASGSRKMSSRIPWRLATQGLTIVIALIIVIMALVLVGDYADAGENYEGMIILTAGTGMAALWVLLLNVPDLVLRLIRRSDVGIHPTWMFALSLIVWLATLTAAIMVTLFVALEFDDKYNDWINHESDLCWNHDVTPRESWSCKDGFWDRVALFVTRVVFDWILFVIQGVVFFTWVTPTWKAHKAARKIQSQA